MTDPDDLAVLVETTHERHGRIDAVVNNTGHPPSGDLLDDVDEETRERIPTGRPARTAEMADAVAYLLSLAASYVTGQNVRVDGGLTASV